MLNEPERGAIRLPSVLVRRLLGHAVRELPNEACALLGGDPATRTVRTAHAVRNLMASPYRYEVDPRDLVDIVHRIEREGDDLVAIFHSHPGGSAMPSRTDVRDARYPVVHLLASMSGGEERLRAWTIGADGQSEVPVVIEGGEVGAA
jgi:[CysO sulfur-carrier protein]-S-L-cysteine hydrolase